MNYWSRESFLAISGIYPPSAFAEHSRTIVASEVRLYEIDFFKDVINRDPVASDWFMATITSRWFKTECRLQEITSYEPRLRIRRLYQQLSRPVIDAYQQIYQLNELVTFKEMADLTGTTRQLVAQELKTYSLNANLPVRAFFKQSPYLIVPGYQAADQEIIFEVIFYAAAHDAHYYIFFYLSYFLLRG